MSGNEIKFENPSPARSEFKMLLRVWKGYDRDLLTDKEIIGFSLFMNRESVERGYVDTDDAYKSVIVEGVEL